MRPDDLREYHTAREANEDPKDSTHPNHKA